MQQLRVATAALQAMAARWGASAGELGEAVAPAGLTSSSQPSAAAVNAVHADVGAFTAELATRVDTRAKQVADANTRYVANEADSANKLAAVTDSPIVA
jgi:hypothetical protein